MLLCAMTRLHNMSVVCDLLRNAEVITLYEKQLKQMNPHTKHITYDIQNLMNFIDSLPDLGALA